MPRERKSSQTKTRNSKRNGSNDAAPAPGSKEDRRAKLEIYLKDFDLQTESKIKEMNAREKDLVQKLEQEFILYKMKIPPQVMSMKLTDFVEKYNGDIGVYQRQFASADDSVDNLLFSETDLDPKTVGSSGSNHNINNNNIKDEEKTADVPVVVEKISSPRKRHSNEENGESSDTLAPLPKTVANKQTLAASKFETPAAAAAKGGAASASTGSASTSTSVFETPTAAGRAPLVACTPSNTRPPRRSELENPNLTSKLVLYKESKSGSPLAQDLREMGTPELKNIQAQIDRMMKSKSKQK